MSLLGVISHTYFLPLFSSLFKTVFLSRVFSTLRRKIDVLRLYIGNIDIDILTNSREVVLQY